MSENDVPDSTDWLLTPLSGFAAVESALRCQVCKDFYKTPMITSCSHTFCSLCIRRALSNDSKCPLCRAPDQELKLRSNWSIEETVDAFVRARTVALELARSGGENSLAKRKAEDDNDETNDAPEGKRLRTSSRLRKPQADMPVADATAFEDDEIVEIPDDDEYVPGPEDGLVPCPVCQSRMKDWQVFKHLESCPGPTPPKPRRAAAESSSSASVGFSQLQRQQTKPPDRLPALSYSMFKEQALRKKMAEIGISNQGSRALLERRHKEWVTLWNANCDAARPKKRGELLQDLDIWERTQGGRAPVTGRAAQSAAVIKDKDFDGAAWATKHDSSFKDLIASARKSRLEAKKKMEEAKEEEAKKVSNAEPSLPAPVSAPAPSEVLANNVETTVVPVISQPAISQPPPQSQVYEAPAPPPQVFEGLSYPQAIPNNHWDPHHQIQPSTQAAWQPIAPVAYPSRYNAESYAYQANPNTYMTHQQQPASSWNNSVQHTDPSSYAATEEFSYQGNSHVRPPEGPNGLP
ncbi:hypothetical protein BGZ61DRAFT_391133 [Ilyonectria robusta]|uniref:uncharacterized protein n=1 Tax=Ilyonectria robusta TaxID=1079257 RepID=UPI001E8ED192|nr:uncharacterized protein BGZ61DRAFT_391133 [Ilyonectria robusta]KAH8688082.1 hypothetical protein BGZ61DRAFT_391133 [Ilyonectria robusta]